MIAVREPLVVPASLVELLSSPTGRDAIARGGLNVLSFEPVRASLGERWGARREYVWTYVQQALERHFSRGDVVERISEIDFLVLILAENSAVAQTACLRSLQEILVHFLGACKPSDLSVKTVTDVDGGELTCRPVDPTGAFRATDTNPAARAAPVSDVQAKGAEHAAALRSSILGHDLIFNVENVISVRHNALAGGRLRRRVTPSGGSAPLSRMELCALDTATLAKIDLETLALARDLLAGASAQAYPVLRTPVSLQTLGHSLSRNTYMNLLRTLPEEATRRVLVEIVNLDEGTPSSRVGEAVALLSGLCRGVIAFTDPTTRALAALRGNRLAGVTVEADQLGRPGTDRRLAIMNFAEAAQVVTPITAIRGTLSDDEIAAARAVTITYLISPALEHAARAA